MSADLTLINFELEDRTAAFDIYKAALHDVIQSAFGWSEEFQRMRFRDRYDLSWFYWIEADSKRIGYVCFHESVDDLHVSLLIIHDEFRGQGYGQAMMAQLLERARANAKPVTLSSFLNNEGAIRFYKKLGYEIDDTDDYFADLSMS